MRMSRSFAAVAAAAVVSALFAATPLTSDASTQAPSAAGARAGAHGAKPATRVLIVLFDQMLPQYADQFAMPNFRRLRDQGRDYRKAYLGYMASETVIAHNVITSGLHPNHMGYTDEAYRDTRNVFKKGFDAMHITGDLTLDDFVIIEKNDGRRYPKLADYLHRARPGSKFITVGEKSYAVESATGRSGDIAVRLSDRESDVTSDYPK